MWPLAIDKHGWTLELTSARSGGGYVEPKDRHRVLTRPVHLTLDLLPQVTGFRNPRLLKLQKQPGRRLSPHPCQLTLRPWSFVLAPTLLRWRTLFLGSHLLLQFSNPFTGDGKTVHPSSTLPLIWTL